MNVPLGQATFSVAFSAAVAHASEPAHTPDVHVVPQALPQPPQLALSVWTLASQPSAWLPLQSTKPLLHAAAHVPLAHTAVALAGAAHVTPHALQFLGSNRVSTHVPLHDVSGVAQVAAHAPFTQAWPALQVTPHAPQLVRSLASVAQ